MNTYDLILKYGISIRQIPEKVFEIYDIRHLKEGDEIVEQYGRNFCKRTIIPKHAGYWMSQICRHTSSTICWRSVEHNLAATLEESVTLCVAKITGDQK